MVLNNGVVDIEPLRILKKGLPHYLVRLSTVLEVFLHSHSSITHAFVHYGHLTLNIRQLILNWGVAFVGLVNRLMLTHASIGFLSARDAACRKFMHRLSSLISRVLLLYG